MHAVQRFAAISTLTAVAVWASQWLRQWRNPKVGVSP